MTQSMRLTPSFISAREERNVHTQKTDSYSDGDSIRAVMVTVATTTVAMAYERQNVVTFYIVSTFASRTSALQSARCVCAHSLNGAHAWYMRNALRVRSKRFTHTHTHSDTPTECVLFFYFLFFIFFILFASYDAIVRCRHIIVCDVYINGGDFSRRLAKCPQSASSAAS